MIPAMDDWLDVRYRKLSIEHPQPFTEKPSLELENVAKSGYFVREKGVRSEPTNVSDSADLISVVLVRFRKHILCLRHK